MVEFKEYTLVTTSGRAYKKTDSRSLSNFIIYIKQLSETDDFIVVSNGSLIRARCIESINDK